MRILGLDIGSFSIKAVEMDSAFGRYDIHDYHEQVLPPDAKVEEAIVQMVRSLPKAPDKIVLALPSGKSTFRILNLPTRQKKVIQSGVGFELEDELPFPMEDCAYDYAVLSQSKQGSTIHVAATLKKHLGVLLQSYQAVQFEPDVVTTETWAYRTLFNRILGNQDQEAPVLLAQLGHQKSIFYLHWRGAPALIHELGWGGRDLTKAICTQQGIPLEQAESMKLDHGFVPSETQSDLPPEQSELSQCLEEALTPLINELKQIELMSRNLTHHSISGLYLSGGTALLPGLGPWIEKKIKTPTRPLLSLSSITTSGVTYSEQTDARLILAAALTLTQVGPDRALCINFRKGDFAKENPSREIHFSVLKKPLLAVGVIAACFFLSLFVQSTVYQSQLKSVNTQLERSVRSFFGQISASGLRTYMSNTTLLRTSINKELKKQRELAKLFGPNPHSPLDFLNSLSSGVPKDVVVDLIQFQAGQPAGEPFTGTDQNNSTTLTFTAANPQIIEKLASSVSGRVSSLQRGKTEEIVAADTGTKKWKITFTGKPNENP